MGLFNFFNKAPTLNEQQGTVTEKSGFLKRVFGFRTQTARNQLKEMGLRVDGVDGAPLSLSQDVSKAFHESDLTDAEKDSMRAVLLSWAQNLTSQQIRDAMASNEDVLIKLAYGQSNLVVDSRRIEAVKYFEIQELEKLLNQKLAAEQVAGEQKNIAQATPEKKRLTLETIRQRSIEATKKLSSFGLKVVDRYNSLDPKTKIGLGVAFAGLGIATSGASSLVTKSLSVGSVARGVYEKGEQIAKDQGRGLTKEEKIKLTIKALSIGGLIGVAGPNLAEELINLIPQDYNPFSNVVQTPQVTTPLTESVVIESPATVMDSQDVSSGDVTQVEENITPKSMDLVNNDYVVQYGDSLEKIMMNRLFSEDVGLTTQEKLTKIYNVLSSEEGRSALQSMGIADSNNIQAGQHIDLSKLTQLLK